MLTIPMIGWVAKLGSNRAKARQLLASQVRRADRQRLAVVSGRRQRRPESQRTERHRQRPERRQRARRLGVSARLGAAHGRHVGLASSGGLKLLHSRQRAQHLAFDAPRRPPHRRDHGRDPDRSMIDYAAPIKAVDPSALVVGSGRVGLERLLLQRLRPAVRRPARLELAARPQRARRPGLPALAARASCTDAIATGKRLLDVFTVHYYPQGGEFGNDTSARPCSCCATARPARSGIRTTSTRPGSTTRYS